MANQKDLENALRYSELRKQGKYDEARKIDLSHADLSYADLSLADLTYADLSLANLSLADLSYADLENANLSGAKISIGNVNRRMGTVLNRSAIS